MYVYVKRNKRCSQSINVCTYTQVYRERKNHDQNTGSYLPVEPSAPETISLWSGAALVVDSSPLLHGRLRLDRSMALYIYKAKNCKLLVLFTHAQKTKFLFK